MSQFFSDMLLGKLPTSTPELKGRSVLFAGQEGTGIRLTTGSMSERVLGYLYLRDVPCPPQEVAVGVNSNLTWAKRTLCKLIELGEVIATQQPDGIVHYALSADGTKKAHELPVLKHSQP